MLAKSGAVTKLSAATACQSQAPPRQTRLGVGMLDEHEERFRLIVRDYLEHPAGDYAELLHRGRVTSPEGVDPEAWREEIRRQARQDRIRVITRRAGTSRAFAMLNPQVSDELALELMQDALVVHPVSSFS
jgi:hypothetical protein